MSEFESPAKEKNDSEKEAKQKDKKEKESKDSKKPAWGVRIARFLGWEK